MSSTLDRLRRLQSLRPQRNRPEPTYEPLDEDEQGPLTRLSRAGRLDELAPGVQIETPAGYCYVVTERYALDAQRGHHRLGDLLQLQPSMLAPFHPEFALADQSDFTRAAFIDTETTGLGGGAGVYAFMVGVGTFEDFSFVVRQFFMRHPGEEAAVLAAVAALLADREMAVTFNGRTFDLPLLRARYAMNRSRLAPAALRMAEVLEEDRPHLDLLHPARRLWRRRLQSCRLINLEQMILGLQRSEDDVPGSLIPYLYVDYVRTGQAGAMSRVFYHNREDIVSMVALAHHLIQAYATPDEAEEGLGVQGEDWLALGISYEKRDEPIRAEAAYRRALDAIADGRMRADAFAHLALLFKRQERWAEAADVWQLWLTSVPGVDPTPYVELAKYCEWQANDLEQAEMWAAWALHNLENAPVYQRLPGQMADLEHRLERVRRKRAVGTH